jgi:rhodanese-related sulfurtransferase
VAAAKEKVKETTVDAVRQWMEEEHEFHLVDVREDGEWAKGHLPDAIHLGKGIIERDVEKTIADHDAKIVLYCGGGYRSALAAEALQKMGYRDVWSMDGGFSGWKEAGLPVVED